MYMQTYEHTYTFHGSTSLPQRQQDVKQVINTQIYTIVYRVKYYKHFKKQCYRSSLHIKNSST